MGVKKLNDLSCDPFDLGLLYTRLQGIVPHFLCARWHRRLQVDNVRERWEAAAIRNQAQVNTPQPTLREERELLPEARHNMERTRLNTSMSPGRPDPARPTTDAGPLESSHLSGQRMIETLLREEGAPLNLSGDYLTVLSIEREEGDEILLCLKDFRPTSSLEDETCGICLEVEQNDSLVLKCGRCTSCVHLGCMSTWLQSLSPGSKSSCVVWYVKRLCSELCGARANQVSSKSDAPFDAYYDMRTVEAAWNQRQKRASAADHRSLPITVHDNEQPPVPITPSVETSPTPAEAVLGTAGPSTHQVRQGSEHVDYPLLPVAPASSDPPSLRRSVRKRRAPDRYEA
ncbi:hypothetical protein N7490_002016 [Penicillium lividum]|nr:hypothetical protein N7490_002016 [Penicillium lividum]